MHIFLRSTSVRVFLGFEPDRPDPLGAGTGADKGAEAIWPAIG